MKTRIIFIALVLSILTLSMIAAADSYTFTRENKDLGKVSITLSHPQKNIFSIFSNLFALLFSKTSIYAGEQVEISDTFTYAGTPCDAPYYWEILINKNGGSYTSLGDIADAASKYGSGCNWQVDVAWASTDTGTYNLQSKLKRTSSSSISTSSGGNSLTVIPAGPTCEWQDWELDHTITGGHIESKEYKDLNLADNDPCDEYSTKYQTVCNSGYYVTGYSETTTVHSGELTCTKTSSGCPAQNGFRSGVEGDYQCHNGVIETCAAGNWNWAANCGGTGHCSNDGGITTGSTQEAIQELCDLSSGCTNGQTQACSTNGASNDGTRTCNNGIWGNCIKNGGGGSGNGSEAQTNKVTLTWTEFYSEQDADLYGEEYYTELKSPSCNSVSDCPSKEGYNVTCQYSKIYADRYISYVASMCDKQLTWLNEFTDFVRWLIPLDYEGVDICTEQGQQQAKNNGQIKFCIAESQTWYGQIWEKYLKIVGGLGIPTQWVLLASIGILLGILMVLTNVIKR